MQATLPHLPVQSEYDVDVFSVLAPTRTHYIIYNINGV